MKIKRDFKVKVRALCTTSLCRQCKYSWDNNRCYAKNCYECEMGGKHCKCTTIKEKQPCPYYVRANKQEA